MWYHPPSIFVLIISSVGMLSISIESINNERLFWVETMGVVGENIVIGTKTQPKVKLLQNAIVPNMGA